MRRKRERGVEDACFLARVGCRDGRALLKSTADRDLARSTLRELSAAAADLDVLGYVIALDHLHLVLECDSPAELSRFMGAYLRLAARRINSRRGRSGNLWGDGYRAILLQQSTHLGRAMLYLDTHSARTCGVARSASWEHGGYREIVGHRERFRVLDPKRVARHLGLANPEKTATLYRQSVDRCLRLCAGLSEPHWTQAAAVGTPDWIDQVAMLLPCDVRRSVQPVAGGVCALDVLGRGPVPTAALNLTAHGWKIFRRNLVIHP